jgi:hypothetical protein
MAAMQAHPGGSHQAHGRNGAGPKMLYNMFVPHPAHVPQHYSSPPRMPSTSPSSIYPGHNHPNHQDVMHHVSQPSGNQHVPWPDSSQYKQEEQGSQQVSTMSQFQQQQQDS